MKSITYISIDNPETKIVATKVNTDTVIQSEYGDILVTVGNYTVEVTGGMNIGKIFGITQVDLDLFYTKE